MSLVLCVTLLEEWGMFQAALTNLIIITYDPYSPKSFNSSIAYVLFSLHFKWQIMS